MSVSTLSPDRRLARLKDRTRRRQAVLATFVVAGFAVLLTGGGVAFGWDSPASATVSCAADLRTGRR